jgi:peptidoglycan/xylan/chitin deacetylase (PgdA/CDA1 family)
MAIPRFLRRWIGFPSRYALMRLGITFKESRAYNTTKRVLLTFDDDGERKNIYGILDVLERENVKALFLLTGSWALTHQDIVENIRARGHWVGSHSYDHIPLNEQDDKTIAQQLQKGLRTEIMRPPYGAYDARVRKVVHSLGFKIAYWTIDSLDWKGVSATEIQKNILPKLHKGACILMHLNTPHTLEALPGLIAGIRKRGFELCYDGTEIRL